MENLIFDPLADLNNSFLPEKKQEETIVHLRMQQRNGRKCITIVENLDKYNEGEINLKKINKYFCKTYKCRPVKS